MKLYHGSPKKLKVLVPSSAKGLTRFENQKAVFLCKTFLHAALYAIGKTLKGKTSFLVSPRKLVILGKEKPGRGYVYGVDVVAKKGPRGQYAFGKGIKDFKVKSVYPKDYKKNIIHVDDMDELKGFVK